MTTWSHIAAAIKAQGTCALVTIASARGSVPREAGAAMVVTREGYYGSIGGGTLEWRAIGEAQAMIAKGDGNRIFAQALGPDLGQCCGGHVEISIEVFGAVHQAEAESLAQREGHGVFTHRRFVGGRMLEQEFGEDRRLIYLFGAGHVGRALVMALAALPFEVQWIDPRPQAFPGVAPGNVTMRQSDEPSDLFSSAPPGSLVFVMTHSHALDLAVVDAALRNPAIAHTGLIGSASKRARFEKRLLEAGVDAQRVADLICPIGLGDFTSKHPAAIAIAVAAQILVLDEGLRLAKPIPAHQSTLRFAGQ
jgi:xanthine dehydrogenase accessory factor